MQKCIDSKIMMMYHVRYSEEVKKMDLSKAILTYRAKNRLSVRAMADKCGVSTQTIYHIENGLQSPSRITAEKIRLVVEGEDNGCISK